MVMNCKDAQYQGMTSKAKTKILGNFKYVEKCVIETVALQHQNIAPNEKI
jgi:hypothetical protein